MYDMYIYTYVYIYIHKYYTWNYLLLFVDCQNYTIPALGLGKIWFQEVLFAVRMLLFR